MFNSKSVILISFKFIKKYLNSDFILLLQLIILEKIMLNLKKKSVNLRKQNRIGCPYTQNRTSVCFRLCQPPESGMGMCGREAPHAFKSFIQIGIENYEANCKTA